MNIRRFLSKRRPKPDERVGNLSPWALERLPVESLVRHFTKRLELVVQKLDESRLINHSVVRYFPVRWTRWVALGEYVESGFNDERAYAVFTGQLRADPQALNKASVVAQYQWLVRVLVNALYSHLEGPKALVLLYLFCDQEGGPPEVVADRFIDRLSFV